MRLKNEFLNQNYMIPVYYDHQQNKVCMINLSNRKFYLHYQYFKSINTIALFAVVVLLNRTARSWRPRLYLYNYTQILKISLILIAILLGVLLLWLALKKRYQTHVFI